MHQEVDSEPLRISRSERERLIVRLSDQLGRWTKCMIGAVPTERNQSFQHFETLIAMQCLRFRTGWVEKGN